MATKLIAGTNIALSENDLRTKKNVNGWSASTIRTSTKKTTGKWYLEIQLLTQVDASNSVLFGIVPESYDLNSQFYIGQDSVGDGVSFNGSGYGSLERFGTRHYVNGDVIGVALDLDSSTGDMYFYRNGILDGRCLAGIKTKYLDGVYLGASLWGNGQDMRLNFGASSFVYPIPDGYQAWDVEVIEFPPTNLTASAGDSKVTLNWNAVTDATGYNVKRATTAGGPYTTIASNVSGTSYVDSTATNGITYYYVVTAITTNGEGTNSNAASATPKAEPTGNALLRVVMSDSSEREYELTVTEINGFINWFNKHTSTDDGSFMFNKVVGSQKSKEYLAFNKIISFEVIPVVK